MCTKTFFQKWKDQSLMGVWQKKHLILHRITLGQKYIHEKRDLRIYDNGGVALTYAVDDIPNILCQISYLGGKLKEVWWSSPKYRHISHNMFCWIFRETFNLKLKYLFIEVLEVSIQLVNLYCYQHLICYWISRSYWRNIHC